MEVIKVGDQVLSRNRTTGQIENNRVAELKPVGYQDNAVGSQIGRWHLPEGETCIFWYNQNGIIGQTLGRW